MAVEEEAIAEIENAFEQLECRYEGYYYNLIEVTKQALKKQMPKKVLYEYDGYYDDVPVYDIARCPNCDCAFEEDYNWNSKHCPNCGQRLDWGEEENDN